MDKKTINDSILEIIKDESNKANVRQFTCIYNWGYSQFERDIADRICNELISPYCTIKNIKEIIKLNKLSKKRLRKLNLKLERAYIGRELTRKELIYQIVFLKDAPLK